MNKQQVRQQKIIDFIQSKDKASNSDILDFLGDSIERTTLQKMIDAEQSDLFDVLTYISFLTKPISRVERVERSKDKIFKDLDEKQKEFLDFVLSKYEEKGVEELDEEKLPVLLNLKYHAIANAEQSLGSVDNIRSIFFAFQKNLYARAEKAYAYK